MSTALSPAEARRAINALRDGVPPDLSVSVAVTVGQSDLLKNLEDALDAVRGGGYDIRILVGNPGEGKSHLLKNVHSLASKRKFLISYSSQDLAAGITLNRPDLVYSQIMRRLGLPGTREGSALDEVMHIWSDKAMPVLAYKRPTTGMVYALAEAGLVPPASQIPLRTRLALVGCLLARKAAQPDVSEVMISVLKGSKVENREVILAAERAGLERAYSGWTPNNYDDSYWFGQLSTLCYVCRVAGFGGIVGLLDELESLVELKRSPSRNKAYRVLHNLLFNAYKATGMLLLFAFTPDFLTRLEEDIAGGGDRFSANWQDVLETHANNIPRLTSSDAGELIIRLATLHAAAYQWQGIEALRAHKDELVRAWTKKRQTVRDLVRATIHALDQLNPSG